MVTNEGAVGVHIGGRTGIPLPTPDTAGYHSHMQAARKATGLDWEAITPRCSACGERSGQLDASSLCPPCRGVTLRSVQTPHPPTADPSKSAHTYQTVTDDDIIARFTAPTTPKLGAEVNAGLVDSFPANGADEAPDEAKGTVTSSTVPASAPTIRAKVARVGDHDICITLRSRPPAPIDHIKVAGLVADLLAALNDQSSRPDTAASEGGTSSVSGTGTSTPATPRRKGKATKRGGGNTGHSRKAGVSVLDPHADDIIRRYQAGENAVQIAPDYGVVPSTIRNLLRNRGITLRPPHRFGQNTTAASTSTGDTTA